MVRRRALIIALAIAPCAAGRAADVGRDFGESLGVLSSARQVGTGGVALEDPWRQGSLVEATTIAPDRLCTACFSGEYPLELPDEDRLGKHLLESPAAATAARPAALAVDLDPEGLTSLVGGGGAADALSRP